MRNLQCKGTETVAVEACICTMSGPGYAFMGLLNSKSIPHCWSRSERSTASSSEQFVDISETGRPHASRISPVAVIKSCTTCYIATNSLCAVFVREFVCIHLNPIDVSTDGMLKLSINSMSDLGENNEVTYCCQDKGE